MNIKAISWIESAVFFLLANIIMLLGSDFPPPVGFLWITLTAALMAVIQWFYVRWLLANDMKRATLFITLAVFALLGIVVPVIFVAFRGGFQTGTGIGIFITMIVFIGYGFALWIVNRFLKNHLG
ncbi:MAG: hypothetical protein II828_03175 [Clostridia bacterium]|nr:hypothetical protein [Clostridia bacterium]